MEQAYLIIENNVVDNVVLWNGNPQTWTPPSGSIQLVQSTTPAMIWQLNTTATPPVYQLEQVIGVGDIGFTWNGTVLTTNQPQPTYTPPAAQPKSTGTKSA